VADLIVQLRIDALDEEGRGVGRANGRELHVAGTIPGETVRARVEHDSPHNQKSWATLVEVVTRAEERVPPACPGHGACGGCAWQHIAYPAQLTEKRRAVERELGTHPALAKLKVDDCVASPHELHYRNKAKYVIAPGPRGAMTMGSYAPATHQVVDMAGCQVPEEPIDRVARAAVRHAAAAGVAPYDEPKRAGELRYLVVRANADGEVLVVYVANTIDSRTALARAAHELRQEFPAVRGVVMNVNAAHGGAIFGAEDVLLEGVPSLADDVGGVRLELSARSFFQVNRAQAERLYEEVARAAGVRTGLRVIDLYCGVGGIGLSLARRGAVVVGIEVLEEAIADARRSATAASLDGRAHFRVGYAGPTLPAAVRQLGGVDVIVVNPPRKGLGADVRTALRAAAPPRIVYVSCGPRSLGVDLDDLVAHGYKVARVRPFDLMPGTPHVETVVTLVRRS
jgi:23S rRNA (uracil1939-C5)-methyltransferase